jgi:outer membrane autotransporter protein
VGTADSRQRLTGGATGENRMDGNTWGAYATWYVPDGFYVDLTGRWMAADIRSISSVGTINTRAHTAATSLEAGYQWKLGGLTLVPQVQYTRTEVQDVRTLHGDITTFSPEGGTFTRTRLGLEANKAFDVNGVRWTPYASLSAVRESDGEATFTVADAFHGRTSIEGTSTMAEIGLGVQKGGFGFTLGANWTDGGALDGFFGGQAVVRYSW